MSVLAYVGLPGSGKSYGVVANQVLPALKEGRLVVTNLPVKSALLREMIPGCEVRTFEVSEICEQPERIDEIFPAGCVAVIDEVWRLWPAGQKVDRIPAPFKSFLAEHRHRVDKKGRSTQVVLVTQDLAQVAAFARQLVEQTFVHRKLGSLGMRGKYTVSVYDGNVTGLTPPESKRIAQNMGSYNKDVFRFYESHTMKEGETSGADERPIDERGNVWRRPAVWLGFAAALAGLGFGGTWVYQASRDPGAALGPAVGGTGGAAHVRPSGGGGGVAAVRAAPAVWRVSGYLQDSQAVDGGVAFVSDGTADFLVPLTSCAIGYRVVTCDFRGSKVDSAGRVYDGAATVAAGNGMPLGAFVLGSSSPLVDDSGAR